jgi:hypothetical protein
MRACCGPSGPEGQVDFGLSAGLGMGLTGRGARKMVGAIGIEPMTSPVMKGTLSVSNGSAADVRSHPLLQDG